MLYAVLFRGVKILTMDREILFKQSQSELINGAMADLSKTEMANVTLRTRITM